MIIQITWLEMEPTEAQKQLVTDKLAVLDEYLASFEEELKQAEVRIRHRSRWGFEVSLDMMLAEKHIFSKAVNSQLMNALVEVRERAEKQIEEYVEKLRGGW